ncbi:MAG: putative sulfate exporter family transporter [Kordiimonadales bacterium]|nr:MAG: putative sulfate exporter family transporter [Kordiimonadales bacterium]
MKLDQPITPVTYFVSLTETARLAVPGFMLALVLAMAASFVAMSYGGPTMLFALLFGMAFNFLAKDTRCAPGLQLASKSVLRVGVALLGLQLTLGDLAAVGWATGLLVVSGVAITILGGWAIGRLLGLSPALSILSAGAVAICGASAALAIAAVLPRCESRDGNLILVVASVTALSTIAMIFYPPLAHFLGLDGAWAGVFFGATIHDIAQVIGAGYAVSDVAGETAVIVKLIRVACLVPVVVMIGLFFKSERSKSGSDVKTPLLPLFLVGFVILVLVNSTGIIPEAISTGLSDMSRWCLITAVAALGVKTNLREVFAVGSAPLLALVAQTVLLAVFALCGIMLLA